MFKSLQLQTGKRLLIRGGTTSVGLAAATIAKGMVGNKWSFESFSPMEVIPTAVNLTTYAGEVENFMQMSFAEFVQPRDNKDGVGNLIGNLRLKYGRTSATLSSKRCTPSSRVS